MRILLLNQFFWPDSAATSQILTDLARELAGSGHEVIAVCGSSSYAAAGQSGDLPGIRICRTPTLRFARRSTAARVFSYASFLASALWTGLVAKKPDLVITLTTPPLLSLVGNCMKMLRGTRHWIWEMDLYPDVAVELGWFRRGGLLDRVIGGIADWSRHRADGILVLGECMKERLIGRGIAAEKLHIAHNWADGSAVRPLPFPDKPELQVLYSGNLGLAHDVDTVRAALPQLNGTGVARFLFNGGGPRRSALEAWSNRLQLTNIAFSSYSNRESLGETLAAGDIGLVTQRDECIGTVVPSKVYGLLAAGRPILYIGPKGSTPHSIIDAFKCGWQIDCGDAESLIHLLHTLKQNRELVHAAGRAARRAFVENFDLPLGTARIAQLIGADSRTPLPERVRNAA